MNSQLPRSIDSDFSSESSSSLPSLALFVSVVALAISGVALYLTLTREGAPAAPVAAQREQTQNAEKLAREALELARRNAADIEALQREFVAFRRSSQDAFSSVANTLREIRAELAPQRSEAESTGADIPVRGS